MTLGTGGGHGGGTVGGRVIGGSSPDLSEIIFKTCERKGIFLTFFPLRHPRGKRRGKEADGELGEGLGRGRVFQGRGSSARGP